MKIDVNKVTTRTVVIELNEDEANHLATILNFSDELWSDQNKGRLKPEVRSAVEATSDELWNTLDDNGFKVLRD